MFLKADARKIRLADPARFLCEIQTLARCALEAVRFKEFFLTAQAASLYGLGVGMPLLVAGATAGALALRLDGAGWKVWVDRTAGLVLPMLGFYLLWVA